MKTAATVAQMLVRVTGVINIVLGVLLWTHHALRLLPVHMQVGYVLVLSLWVLALLAARAGVNPAFVGVAIVWGFLVPVLGAMQARLAVGNAHWAIQLLHLLVGMGAIGLAEGLAVRIRQERTHALQP